MTNGTRQNTPDHVDWREEAQQARRAADVAREQLDRTRKSLMQAEQLASLGSRVASVAHEISTPIGNSLTVATALQQKTEDFLRHLQEDTVRRSELDDFLEQICEAAQLLNRNLEAAGDQIQNFKRVAVDQASARRRRFDLFRVVNDVVDTLRPQIKRTGYQVTVEIPEEIEMDSYPGALGQIITNCFNNAVTHGFDGCETGHFRITAEHTDNGEIQIVLADDGKGMSKAQLEQAFDRFYTTRGEHGGSGLGLSIVHTIATEILRGSVRLASRPNEGTAVYLLLPPNPDHRALPCESNDARR